MSPSANTRRPDNLPLIFQEVFTAIERLRSNRQGVSDSQSFRHHTREALKTAASQALARLARRNMQLNCTIQDEQVWLADS